MSTFKKILWLNICSQRNETRKDTYDYFNSLRPPYIINSDNAMSQLLLFLLAERCFSCRPDLPKRVH